MMQNSIRAKNTEIAPEIILASSSTYRKELFERLRLPFLAIAPDIDESALAQETPIQAALRLAQEKAEAIAALHPGYIVIGSDQVATLQGEHIGKPGNHENALAQLLKMRGEEVIFHSALCVIDNRMPGANQAHQIQIENCQTRVRFRNLSEAELDAYLRIETPYDCAGSAKNEGLGIALIEKIQSDDPTALTGLPLITLTSMLMRLKISFFQ
ncbi:MAG: Maf family nucleotide pyrophosphatase [Undibacterium sp.]|nr:Maf family nucleotide pyrophosphatase [Undibacterium sp.]